MPNDFLVASESTTLHQRLIVDAINKEPAANRPCTGLPDEAIRRRVARPSPVRSATAPTRMLRKDDFRFVMPRGTATT